MGMHEKMSLKDYYTKYANLLNTKLGGKGIIALDKLMLFVEGRIYGPEKPSVFLELELIIGLLGSMREPYKSTYHELHIYCEYHLEKMLESPETYKEIYGAYESALYHLREYLELKVVAQNANTDIPLEVQKVLVELLRNFTLAIGNVSTDISLKSPMENASAGYTDTMLRKEKELEMQLKEDIEILNRRETAPTRYAELRTTLDSLLNDQTTTSDTRTSLDIPPKPTLESTLPPLTYTKTDILDNFEETKTKLHEDLTPFTPEKLEQDVNKRYEETKQN